MSVACKPAARPEAAERVDRHIASTLKMSHSVALQTRTLRNRRPMQPALSTPAVNSPIESRLYAHHGTPNAVERIATVSHPTVPDDFPRETVQGAIGGYRPKLLLHRVGGQLVAGPTEEDRFARYDACEDLAQQLASYARRKLAEDPSRTLRDLLAKIELDVAAKTSSGQWDISAAEITWMMPRVYTLLAEKT